MYSIIFQVLTCEVKQKKHCKYLTPNKNKNYLNNNKLYYQTFRV